VLEIFEIQNIAPLHAYVKKHHGQTLAPLAGFSLKKNYGK